MPSSLIKIRDGILDILFPPICVVCQKSLASAEKSTMLCAPCRASIPLFETLFCAECHARLPETKKICHEDTRYRLGAASTYGNETMKSLIWNLKYQKHPVAAHTLSTLLIEYMTSLPINWSTYVLVPIPLHPFRLRKRGFNQSKLLSIPIARHFHIPSIHNVLIRVRHTPPQAKSKDHKARKENIANCFALRDPEKIKGKRIILVDDVTTSGATLHEAARVVRSAGAKKVIALVAARAG